MAGPVRTPGSTAGELLAALADHVAQSAIETLHVNPELAEAHGSEVAAQMAQVWGGQQLYVPKGCTYRYRSCTSNCSTSSLAGTSGSWR
ncbi:TPA: hypothetical protein NJF78_003306 [Pseudomonas aeruginosa]|nr:hypothetical protein [Pseudomonas aeruginosa]